MILALSRGETPADAAGLRAESPVAFDRTTSMPIPLHSLHLHGSRERERVAALPLAHARGCNPTSPRPGNLAQNAQDLQFQNLKLVPRPQADIRHLETK